MNRQLEKALDEIVDSAVVELLAAYALDATPTKERAALEDHDRLGIIGYTAPHLKGCLVLSSSSAVIVATNEHASSLADWTGEITNQLMGRLKNKLQAYGLGLSVSIPVAVTGMQVQASTTEGPEFRSYHFNTALGSLRVHFNAVTEADFQVTFPPLECSSVREGELLMFD